MIKKIIAWIRDCGIFIVAIMLLAAIYFFANMLVKNLILYGKFSFDFSALFR